MKQFKHFFIALVAVITLGCGQAFADLTEYTLSANGNVSNSPNVGTCYTISGTYVAGGGNGIAMSSANDKGVKMRANRAAGDLTYGIRIDVNEGYIITGVKMYAFTNNANEGCSVIIPGAYVDKNYDNNLLSESVTLPLSSAKSCATVDVSGFAASSCIDFACDISSITTGNAQFCMVCEISYQAPAATPSISYIAGNPSTVTISCASEGANIYYTLDGNDPTAESLLYTGPFDVSEACTVKAFATGNGFLNSEIASMPIIISNATLPAVAYVFNSTYATYCGLSNDPVYQALVATELYNVVAYDVNSKSASDYTELQAYAAVVSTDANSGSNAFGINIAQLVGTVPMVNLKAFYYGAGRWAWGTASNPNPSSATLIAIDKTLALYDGVLFVDNQADMYVGNSSYNQLQGATIEGEDITTLATVADYQAVFSKGDKFIGINYSVDDISELNGNGVNLVLNAVKILLDESQSVSTVSTTPQLSNVQKGGELMTSAQLGVLASGSMTDSLPFWPATFPEFTANATCGGNVEITQPTLANPTATFVVKDASENEVKTYTLTYAVANTNVDLVYTDNQYNAGTGTWSDGTYSLGSETGLSGNNGAVFKLSNKAYTLSMPGNIKVESIAITGYDYVGGSTAVGGVASHATIGISGGATLVSTEGNFGQWGSDYNSATNQTMTMVINHTAGSDIILTPTGVGQLISTIRLVVSDADDGKAPTLESQSIEDGATGISRHGSISFTFNKEMQASTVVFNGETCAMAAGQTLTLYYWNLGFDQPYSLSIPAGTLADKYGNAYAQDIHLDFTVASKNAVEKKAFDFVVGVDGDMDEAIEAANNHNAAERYTIFIPDGKYKLTGNSTITRSDALTDSTGVNSEIVTNYNNAMTWVTASNISLVGQSRNGVVLYNEPLYPGISYTSTLEFRTSASNCYMQDLTLMNNYAYGRHDRGVAVAFYDRGQKNIAKNVKMWSNQDTYVSAGTRGYYENCELCGTVDFICGSGDYYFQNCDLTINNRSGNVICAPRTNASEKWGYVFESCTIDKAEGATSVASKSWSLGRPWNNSPAATYLNTTIKVLPRDAGWTNMTAGCVLRFHEYGSMDANGAQLDLSKRSTSACAGAATSDAPVLSAEVASTYTRHNVVGGADGFDPQDYTAQVAAPAVSADGMTLSWADDNDARCYVIFKDGEYLTNVTTCSYTATDNGIYTVRAANERGGLGEASAAINLMADAIESIETERVNTEAPIYDVLGRRVAEPTDGLYIKNGKVVIVK